MATSCLQWKTKPVPRSLLHQCLQSQDHLAFEGILTQENQEISFALQAATNADLSEEEEPDQEDLCIVYWEQMREVIFCHCMHMVRPHTSGNAPFVTQLCHLPYCLPQIWGAVPRPPCLVHALLGAPLGRNIGSGCIATKRSV